MVRRGIVMYPCRCGIVMYPFIALSFVQASVVFQEYHKFEYDGNKQFVKQCSFKVPNLVITDKFNASVLI